jgi:hypothetical protein
LLLPLFVGLFFVAVAERGHPAASKANKPGGKGGLLAMLADPLSLIAERSPGERGAGALLSTKPGGPQERVLAEVRDRDPAAGDTGAAAPPGPNDPVFGVAPDTFSPGGEPGAGAPGGGDPGGAEPNFSPFAPGGGAPSFFQRGPGTPLVSPGNPGLPGVPGVPEPATWAMLILGFFAVGAAVRRARKHDGESDAPAATVGIECQAPCDP